MAEIKGWFTMNGVHIPIIEGQSKTEAAKKYLGSKYGKDVAKLSNKGSKTEKFTDSKGNIIEIRSANPKEFKKALDEAKKSRPKDDAWRVDNTSHTELDYSKDKLFVTKNGSTVAITSDGDIISVCSNIKGKKDSTRALMEYAVKNGGTKLDSYDGNFGFYTHIGFEPVSYCKFDINYAPNDWRKGIDSQEPIVFFKYKGNVVPITKESFYKKTKMSKDYDTAMKKRDKEVK